MHADLTDASVHVPAEVIAPESRYANTIHTLEERSPGPDQSHADRPVVLAVGLVTGQDAPDLEPTPNPTYDEIAERALELLARGQRPSEHDLQSWVNAERQLRSERTGGRHP